MRNQIETLEQALAYFTPGEGINGPVILSPDKMRKAIEIINKAIPTPKPEEKQAYFYDQEPEFGDIMTVADFLEGVDSGNFIDYDGHGYPMKDGKYCLREISPMGARQSIPENATHILWFNR